MDTPLISVVTLAYNHEPFIRQCMEGVVMQKTTFPFELIIHDDASTDKTADVIREYEARYPLVIKPIYQTENQYSKRASVRKNVYSKVQGKYMAFCEGDDYWTDPNKLQRQVEFLEAHPEYSACVHQCMVVYEYRDDPPTPYTSKIKDTFELYDLLDESRFHLATTVFRFYLMDKIGPSREVVSSDRFLFILFARFGKIKFFPEPMSVYRINHTGISTRITPKMMKKDLNIIPFFVELYDNFPKYRYISFIHKTIIAYPPRVPFLTYLKHYVIYAWYSFSFFPGNVLPLLRFTFLTTPKFAALRLFPRIKWKKMKSYR